MKKSLIMTILLLSTALMAEDFPVGMNTVVVTDPATKHSAVHSYYIVEDEDLCKTTSHKLQMLADKQGKGLTVKCINKDSK